MNADVGLRIEESEKLFALDMSEQMGQCPTVQLCFFSADFSLVNPPMDISVQTDLLIKKIHRGISRNVAVLVSMAAE